MATQKSGGGAGLGKIENSATDAKIGGQVDSVLQGALGKKLRDVYEEVVNEEVPSKFLALLDELKKKEAGSGEQQS